MVTFNSGYKTPELFFKSLFRLRKEGIDFKLIVLGEKTNSYPAIFDEAKTLLSDEIIHFGYCENKEDYYQMLAKADFLPVSSHQDFFGYSIVEAMALGVQPILPNRLAYPEHINENHRSLIFYENDSDFYEKVKASIIKVKVDLSSDVEKYDWEKLIHLYDQEFRL